MNILKLPMRTSKPRGHGITSIHDVGIPIQELKNILSDYHSFIDMAKIGIGSAYITPRLEKKIELYSEFEVDVYFGGTLFEKMYHEADIDHYVSYLKSLGITRVEISTGIIEISLEKRLNIVKRLVQDFVVLAEVGVKDNEQFMPPSQWIMEIESLLDAGCRYVIAEGRSSGTAGLYRPNGDIREGLIKEILDVIDSEKIIFEAPKPELQIFLACFISTPK